MQTINHFTNSRMQGKGNIMIVDGKQQMTRKAAVTMTINALCKWPGFFPSKTECFRVNMMWWNISQDISKVAEKATLELTYALTY